MKRVQCLTVKHYYEPNISDPDFVLHQCYPVIDEKVDVMGEDPWIRVQLPDGRHIERPRAMFGPVFPSESRIQNPESTIQKEETMHDNTRLRKLFFFDTETTGLDPVKNDIISISYIIEINGEIKKRNTLYIQPFDFSTIQPQALLVNGFSLADLRSEKFIEPHLAHALILDDLSEYVDKFNRDDKYAMVAYRSEFDTEFFAKFFLKCSDAYFGSWFNGKNLDPLPILRYLDYLGMINLPNYKLLTVAQNFGFEHSAHDAQSDVEVLYKVFKRITGIFDFAYFNRAMAMALVS